MKPVSEKLLRKLHAIDRCTMKLRIFYLGRRNITVNENVNILKWNYEVETVCTKTTQESMSTYWLNHM